MSKLTSLEKALDRANTYQEWTIAAQALDEFEGKDQWRLDPESDDYDYRLLASRVRLFRKLRKNKDYDQIIFRLREELHGNIGNMANPATRGTAPRN